MVETIFCELHYNHGEDKKEISIAKSIIDSYKDDSSTPAIFAKKVTLITTESVFVPFFNVSVDELQTNPQRKTELIYLQEALGRICATYRYTCIRYNLPYPVALQKHHILYSHSTNMDDNPLINHTNSDDDSTSVVGKIFSLFLGNKTTKETLQKNIHSVDFRQLKYPPNYTTIIDKQSGVSIEGVVLSDKFLSEISIFIIESQKI